MNNENVFDILHVHAPPKTVMKALRNLFFALRDFFIEKVTKATRPHFFGNVPYILVLRQCWRGICGPSIFLELSLAQAK